VSGPTVTTFRSALRQARLARLGERMLMSRFEITAAGRAALAAEEQTT
jgi:hypothetical protein